mgnify:FL=1
MASLPRALTISASQIQALDLTPLAPLASAPVAALLEQAGQLELQIIWPRAADDPRELSEVPEVRLWCLRADALYQIGRAHV